MWISDRIKNIPKFDGSLMFGFKLYISGNHRLFLRKAIVSPLCSSRAIGFLLILATLGMACKSSKDISGKKAKKDITFESVTDTTSLYIDIFTGLEDLNQLVNTQFDTFSFKAEGMQVTAIRRDTILVDLIGEELTLTLPLNIEITRRTLLGKLKANGAIQLSFSSVYDVSPDWQLKTNTLLTDYHWIQEPELDVGGLAINIEKVADSVIKRSKDVVTKTIDEKISNSIDPKEQIYKLWRGLKDPFLLSQDYQAWMKLQPLKASLSKPSKKLDQVHTRIFLKFVTEVNIGQRPDSLTLDPLPQFRWLEGGEEHFIFPIKMIIPIASLDSITKSIVEGESFDLSKKKKVVVDQVDLSIVKNKMMAKLQIGGDMEGQIFLSGQPEVDPKDHRIIFENLEYDISTSNFLVNSMGKLFKGKIKNLLQRKFNAILEENIEDVKLNLDRRIAEINTKSPFQFDPGIEEIHVADIDIVNSGMRVLIRVDGKAKIKYLYKADAL